MNAGQDLGEEMLSKAAEVGMESQLDEAETLDVDIHTDPGKLMQGELDQVEVKGRGLVMQKDLRTEEMDVKTNGIAIDPLKAAFGNVELKRPTEASAHVVLTESDLEHAFHAEYIQRKLQGLPISVKGQPMTANLRNVQFSLLGDRKFLLSTEVHLVETDEVKQTSFSAEPRISNAGHQVVLENVQYVDSQELSPELTDALLESASTLMDLRNFELKGMSFRLKALDVQDNQVVMEAEATVRRFPGE